jgi:hypothetical protein
MQGVVVAVKESLINIPFGKLQVATALLLLLPSKFIIHQIKAVVKYPCCRS